jgi:hypothetical protein
LQNAREILPSQVRLFASNLPETRNEVEHGSEERDGKLEAWTAGRFGRVGSDLLVEG